MTAVTIIIVYTCDVPPRNDTFSLLKKLLYIDFVDTSCSAVKRSQSGIKSVTPTCTHVNRVYALTKKQHLKL